MPPTENKYMIPTEKWNRLGSDNQESFNQVYGKVSEQKGDFLNQVPTDLRNQFAPILDKVITEVVATTVMELHHA